MQRREDRVSEWEIIGEARQGQGKEREREYHEDHV